MRIVKKSLTVSVAAAFLAISACSNGAGGGGGGDGGGEVLRVVVADAEVASWTVGDLEKAVPIVEIVVDGDTQSGPRLLDVLAAAGVDDWQIGEVLGKGEGRSFDVGLEISASDVDEGWILDVSNRGTLKLASANLPRQLWVRDVAEIRFP